MSALAERSKVNLDLCNLFIAIVTLDKAYQVRIMTLAFKNFPIKMHKEANLTLTLSRSRSTQDQYLNKLGRPRIPDATYQVLRSRVFWFWRRRFLKGFYHIWAWRPSWSCDQGHLNKLSFPYPKESPYEI